MSAQALLAAAIAFATAVVTLAVLLRSFIGRRLIDHPGRRSLHSIPTPRIGGLGVLAGLVAGLAVGPGALPSGLYPAVGALALVSVLDDVRGLSAAMRLPLHLLAAAFATAAALPQVGWPLIAGGAVLLAWSTNLYNFMDGSDGLAGSMAVIGFGAYAIAATPADPALAAAALTVAAAAAGFLLFNLPPARVFMGDAGSTSLGLLAGAVGAVGVDRGLWSPLLPAMVFMPFLFDATATLFDRALRRCRVWEAHREHAYQRMNLGGLGHRRTAVVYAGLMMVSAVVALAARASAWELAVFLALMAIHGFLWLAVRLDWHEKPPVAGNRF